MDFPNDRRDLLVLVVGALFALPFIFFSMTGGYFADRYSKRSVTIGTKFLEIGVMAFFIVSLALHNLPMECASVFLISTEGALFGPSKYGLLPELLPEPRLSWGNGIIELGTFVASIGATMAAGVLAERYRGHEAVAGFMLLGVYRCSDWPRASESRASRPPIPRRNSAGILSAISARKSRPSAPTESSDGPCLATPTFFSWPALLQLVIVIYGHDVLRIDDTHTSYLQAAVGHRHRTWQRRRGISFRRKNRIRSDPARCRRHDGLRRAAL